MWYVGGTWNIETSVCAVEESDRTGPNQSLNLHEFKLLLLPFTFEVVKHTPICDAVWGLNSYHGNHCPLWAWITLIHSDQFNLKEKTKQKPFSLT